LGSELQHAAGFDSERWNFEEDVLVLRGKSVGVVTEILPLSHVMMDESGHEHD
jgi:hypothetical protein